MPKIGNQIGDAGAALIAEALKVNTTLTSIDLSCEWHNLANSNNKLISRMRGF